MLEKVCWWYPGTSKRPLDSPFVVVRTMYSAEYLHVGKEMADSSWLPNGVDDAFHGKRARGDRDPRKLLGKA